MPAAHRSILITGFEPFGGMPDNPSGDAARLLSGTVAGNAQIHCLRLPVTAPLAWERMRRAILRHRATVVIAMGVAAGADSLRIECTAKNCADYPIPDNAGRQPRGQTIHRGGQPALPIAAPAPDLLRVLTDSGLPVRLSHDAGLYVCNDLYYRLLRYVARPHSPVRRAFFLHVPEAHVIPPARTAAALRELLVSGVL